MPGITLEAQTCTKVAKLYANDVDKPELRHRKDSLTDAGSTFLRLPWRKMMASLFRIVVLLQIYASVLAAASQALPSSSLTNVPVNSGSLNPAK